MSPDDITICYVLPVLWMTLCFHIMVLWHVMCILKYNNQILLNDKDRKYTYCELRTGYEVCYVRWPCSICSGFVVQLVEQKIEVPAICAQQIYKKSN